MVARHEAGHAVVGTAVANLLPGQPRVEVNHRNVFFLNTFSFCFLFFLFSNWKIGHTGYSNHDMYQHLCFLHFTCSTLDLIPDIIFTNISTYRGCVFLHLCFMDCILFF